MHKTEVAEGLAVIGLMGFAAWGCDAARNLLYTGEVPLGVMIAWWLFLRGMVKPPVQVEVRPAMSLPKEGPHSELEIVLKNTVRRAVSVTVQVSELKNAREGLKIDLAPGQVFPLDRVVRADDYEKDGTIRIGWNVHPLRKAWEDGVKALRDPLGRTSTVRTSGLKGLERAASVNQGGILECTKRIAQAAEDIAKSRDTRWHGTGAIKMNRVRPCVEVQAVSGDLNALHDLTVQRQHWIALCASANEIFENTKQGDTWYTADYVRTPAESSITFVAIDADEFRKRKRDASEGTEGGGSRNDTENGNTPDREATTE